MRSVQKMHARKERNRVRRKAKAKLARIVQADLVRQRANSSGPFKIGLDGHVYYMGG